MTSRVSAWGRARAAAADLGIVVGWAAVAGAVGVALDVADLSPTSVAGRDTLAAATLVVPVALTHAAFEAGPSGATPGKRWVGGHVITIDGERLGVSTAVVRSLVKFAPWQLAHSAVFRLIEGSESPVWLGTATVAQLLVVGSFALLAVREDGRALHDLVAGTKVVQVRAAAAGDSGPAGLSP